MDTGSFAGVKSGLRVTLTPHPFLVLWSKTVELYLYCPNGPYGLYREPQCLNKCALYFFYLYVSDLLFSSSGKQLYMQ